jgi:BirA family biotin operon repressor/biotin-[acetyl-CoA-carboxylase] ligase
MTDAERLLWSRLRGEQLNGRTFTKQFPIGDAVADFACRSAKLIVEVDGGQHDRAKKTDSARTFLIEAYGYRVIRYWNSDVFENLDGVLADILLNLQIAANENPPPRGGGQGGVSYVRD